MPEPLIGIRVMAPWKNHHMYPGRVGAVSKSKDKVKINFDDGAALITSGTYTFFDATLKTWDWAAVIYPLCAIGSVVRNMIHYDQKDSAAIAKAMGGFES